jgi:hypothetical protein
MRALAVTTTARSELLPDMPTVADFLLGFEANFWIGIGPPKNTPAEIVGKLNKEINAGLADPGIRTRLADRVPGRSRPGETFPCLPCPKRSSGLATWSIERVVNRQQHSERGGSLPHEGATGGMFSSFSVKGRVGSDHDVAAICPYDERHDVRLPVLALEDAALPGLRRLLVLAGEGGRR